MLVTDIIIDIESVIQGTPDAAAYKMAAACYVDDSKQQINLTDIGSFHWDDDDEFFLVPRGSAGSYDLEERQLTAEKLLRELKDKPAIHSFTSYARAGVKTLPDGSIASVNYPLWGTGIHEQAKLVYFYYGDAGQPS